MTTFYDVRPVLSVNVISQTLTRHSGEGSEGTEATSLVPKIKINSMKERIAEK